MSFAMLMVVATAVFVLRPARSCEIGTADVFYERYRWRRGIEGTHSGIKRCAGMSCLRVRGEALSLSCYLFEENRLEYSMCLGLC